MLRIFKNFNKKDVIDYIEKLVAEKNQNIESAWNEYKSLESRVNKMMTELEIALAEAQDVQTALAEEKDLLEERALGSEQAFADLEASVAETRAAHAEELEALRAAHAAELENLRASHAEELKAIYAERSSQLDKKNELLDRFSEQPTALTAELHEYVYEKNGLAAFIACDQEGGVVSRVGVGTALFPGAMSMTASASRSCSSPSLPMEYFL